MSEHFADLSLSKLIEKRADATPDALFLIDPLADRTISYRELRAQTESVVSLILDAGGRPGESVAYACHNSALSAMTILGIMSGGFLATRDKSGRR